MGADVVSRVVGEPPEPGPPPREVVPDTKVDAGGLLVITVVVTIVLELG